MVQLGWPLARHVGIVVHSSAVFTTLLSYPFFIFTWRFTDGIGQWSYESWRLSDEATFPLGLTGK